MFGETKDEIVPHCDKIVTSRFIVVPEICGDNLTPQEELSKVDHLEMFKEYIKSTLGNTEIILQELQEVCK